MSKALHRWVVVTLCCLSCLTSCSSSTSWSRWELHTQPATHACGQVILFGFVRHQGRVPWSPGMTARQSIEHAGGTVPGAVLRDIKIVEFETRNGQTWARSRRVDLRHGKPDIQLKDRSVVIVPESLVF